MSKLQALATLVGMSQEYESELHKLQEAKLKQAQVLEFLQRSLANSAKHDHDLATSSDPDAAFYKRYHSAIEAITTLEDSIELTNGFINGVLKYE